MEFKKVTCEDVEHVARMLYDFYQELYYETSSKDIEVYEDYLRESIKKSDWWFIPDKLFLQVVKNGEPINPGMYYYSFDKVYIVPAYRKSRYAYELLEFVKKNYSDLPIYAITDPNSESTPIFGKRHQLMGYVYWIDNKE